MEFLPTRRDWFVRPAALLAGLHSLGARLRAGLRIGPDIYSSLDVRPLVNCRGTFTIISGSQTLPEVKAAMEQASRHYVHLDELMEAVGKRLSELTKAEWGMVSNGCAAALAHATAACMCGGDPEKAQRLPDTRGMKNEVIAPAYSRNVYDHAVRGTGANIVTVDSMDAYERAFNEKTAMIMVLGGPGDDGPLGVRALSPLARKHGVPILVDAAAERLTIPNVHLERGADLVAYSGGKCMRGPQSAGLLLGRKSLIQAAWMHSAPHHAFGRPMKAGKEEILGMLAAVEMWVKRDHDAEWKQWESWLANIGNQARKVNGVTTRVIQPDSLSNNAPRLVIEWNGDTLGISGREVEKALLDGSPRVTVGGASGDRRNAAKSSITIMPYMMMAGDDKIAAEKIHAVLSAAKPRPAETAAAPAVNATGRWNIELEFVSGKANHTLVIAQDGAALSGTHRGEFLAADIRGSVDGPHVRFRSSHRYEGTRIGYDFDARVEGNRINGTVGLGEYGSAKFTGVRSSAG